MKRIKTAFLEWNSSITEFCINLIIITLITVVLGVIVSVMGV